MSLYLACFISTVDCINTLLLLFFVFNNYPSYPFIFVVLFGMHQKQFFLHLVFVWLFVCLNSQPLLRKRTKILKTNKEGDGFQECWVVVHMLI